MHSLWKKGEKEMHRACHWNKICFLNLEKQTYPFTRWKQDQSSSHFLHETGKEGRRTIFTLICSLRSSTHTQKSNTQKGKVHIFPYKIFICIVYLGTIFPPWKTLISFNRQSLPHVQCLRFFLLQPSKLFSQVLVLQLRYHSHET